MMSYTWIIAIVSGAYIYWLGYLHGNISQIKKMKKLGDNFDDLIRKLKEGECK